MRATHPARILLLAFFTASLALGSARAETVNPELLKHSWKARWITHPDGPQREFGVFHFRKTFSLASVPSRFVVHASGDNRYELFVNGERVVAGPARGDLDYWRFESVDIASHLRAGKSVLAAVVWNFAELAPMAQMTNETGFLLQGDGAAESVVNTNESWKSLRNQSLTPIPWDPDKVSGYFVVGPGEDWDGRRYPWDWETLAYDDSNWKSARELDPGAPRGARDSHSRWMLVPRPIPLMEEKLERLERVARTDGIEAPAGFLEGRGPVTIAPGKQATILLDQKHLTSGYPEIIVSGGRGAKITLAYAEALVDKNRQKGNRNEIEGKVMRGFEDIFRPDGGEHRLFRPLWWRTYRYLQIEVETGAEPLVLEDARTLFSAYPYSLSARFESDDPELSKIWDVGWRTLRLSAHETYTDSPYYEQLQYVGDTRITCLITLYTSRDERLVKNAIELFDESRTPDGLTQSRYTSFLPQYIPPYSLFWVGMLHDFWWYRGQPEYLRQYLHGARGVLEWFENRLSPSGLLGRLEWWNFVDWSDEFEDGIPPEDADGQSSILSLQFAAALAEAADLEESFGSRERAEHYRDLAKKISDAVYAACWDSTRGLVADTPARKNFSQHANIFAVLTDAIPAAEQEAVMRRVLTDTSITQATFYFRYYLFRAMKKAGLGDEYLKQLDPWREMLHLGLTTWAEKPEPTRSDCHAWSAHPSFDLLATVAGIEPAAPGFAEVEIRPHLGPLRELKATLPVPQGEITVAYKRAGERLVADVTLPAKLSGKFYWRGKSHDLHAGQQRIEF